MGKRRRRQHSDPEGLPKPLKQQRREDHTANRQPVPVSNSFAGTLPDKPNLCEPLECNSQTELEDRLSVELAPSLSVNESCSWSPAPALEGDMAGREGMTDFLSRQCLLTAQTVNSIYDLLEKVMNKVDCLGESFTSFVRNREGPGFPPKTSNNYSLQTNQVTLQIHDKEARGCWSNRKAIRLSLSQLLRCELTSIDLLNAEWLPAGKQSMRILLLFKHPIIPSMLFRMKPFLSTFSIFPIRVFSSEKVSPLLKQHHQVGTVALNLGYNSLHIAKPEAVVAERPPRRQRSNIQTMLPTAAGAAEDLPEESLIDLFGALPEPEQVNIIQRLDDLKEALTSTQMLVKPLFNSALPNTQSCANQLNQQAASTPTAKEGTITQADCGITALTGSSTEKQLKDTELYHTVHPELTNTEEISQLLTSTELEAPKIASHKTNPQTYLPKNGHKSTPIDPNQRTCPLGNKSFLEHEQRHAGNRDIDDQQQALQPTRKSSDLHNNCVYMGSLDGIDLAPRDSGVPPLSPLVVVSKPYGGCVPADDGDTAQMTSPTGLPAHHLGCRRSQDSCPGPAVPLCQCLSGAGTSTRTGRDPAMAEGQRRITDFFGQGSAPPLHQPPPASN